MAILSQQNLFSDRQAITATAASTNTIDLGPIMAGVKRDIGPGKPIPLLLQVVEDFAAAGAATLAVSLQVDDNTAFSSPKTVASLSAMDLASLKAGKQLPLDYIPRGTDERYMRLNYTVGTGPMTAGRITAGIAVGHQTNG